MKIVRPYVGLNSYDVRTSEGVLVIAVGCFDPQIAHPVAMAFYSELLMTLCRDGKGLVIQFQSHSWQQKRDGKRLGSRGERLLGSEWLAIQTESQEDVLAILLEFWTDKELRFFSPGANITITEDLLEKWFRLYLDDFDNAALDGLGFAADEIWGQGFVILRTVSNPLSRVVDALSLAAEHHDMTFVQQREPFRAYLGPA